jgi:hypothetical protein
MVRIGFNWLRMRLISKIYQICSCMGDIESATKCLLEGVKERDQLADSGVDSTIILNYILRERCVKVWTRINWFRIATVGGVLATG